MSLLFRWLLSLLLSRRLAACVTFVVVAMLAGPVAAQTTASGTGTLSGRVFNATTNAALYNARVTVVGTTRSILTDESGSFLLEGLPSGEAQVEISFAGMATQTAAVTIPAGGKAERDFDLMLSNQTRRMADGDTITLEKVTVEADREMSAQAVALNERLASPNIKQVVAFDEYGDRGGENIGEFLRFLPGVGVTDGGQLAGNLSLRGFPSENTNIQVDGADVSNARGNSRSQSLLDIPMTNVERVEISKTGIPDAPASGMGGSVNLISKTAFSARKPVFNYRTYFILDSKDFNLDGGPRTLSDDLSPNYKQPSFDLSYILPVNKKFGLTFGASRTWRMQPMNRDPNTDTQPDWNFTGDVIRQTTWFSLAAIFQTWGLQGGADWKISDKSTLSVSVQHRYVSNYIMRDSVIFNFGAGVTGTQAASTGAANGVGIVQYGAGPQQETGTDTTHGTIKFTHKERDWKLEMVGAFSRSESFLDDIDNGFFNGMPSNISGLVLRGEGRGEDDAPIHTRYSATRAGVPIDVYDAGNAVLGNPTSTQNHIYANKLTARADFTRDFGSTIPLTLKTGVFVERMNRRADSQAINFTFTPPTIPGLSATDSKLAKYYPVFDEEYLKEAPTIFGHATRFLSPTKYYQLYQAHPEWFPINQVSTYTTRAAAIREITETVSAAYLRADAHFFDRRLWVIGGARFEKTTDDGTGQLIDPTAIYRKDAAGNYILTNGARTLITTDPLEQAKLSNVINGAKVKKSYDDLYPSLNLTYYLTPKLLLRGAAYMTIGRPNLNFITPGTTITDSTSTNPTITVNNTALLPQEARSFEVSLETYQIKGGQGSIGVFQKDIKNFSGAITQRATPELLASYGLPTDDTYLNYNIATRVNAGDAKIIGYEFGYKQSLYFLPGWAQGFTVFANATKLELSGSNTADFTGYAPETFAGGISYARKRVSVSLTMNYQAETRNTLVGVSAANGIPANTYNWFGENKRIGLSASYAFSKRFIFYGNISHLNGRWDIVNRQYPEGAPEYQKDRRRQELGAVITLGVKGTF